MLLAGSGDDRRCPHGRETGATRMLLASTGRGMQGCLGMCTHGSSRGCGYARRRHGDGWPRRPRRRWHLHGRPCHSRRALRARGDGRDRHQRHPGGRRSCGRNWRSRWLRGHRWKGRGSRLRCRSRLRRCLGRPRHGPRDGSLCRSGGRRLRYPGGRGPWHLWTRSSLGSLRHLRSWHGHLLRARWHRRMSCAGRHLLRA